MRFLPRAELSSLFDALRASGRRVIGPTRRDHAIVHDELESADELPIGWTDEQAPGRYRLKRRDDERAFGFVVGPHSWKRELFPPREPLYRATRRADGKVGFAPIIPEPAPSALLGVRACDLAAMQVQDRTFEGSDFVEPRYMARRAAALVVAVNCTEPGALCFCASTGTGPRVGEGADLVLTERDDGFFVEAASDDGRAILDALPTAPASDAERAWVDEAMADAATKMGRQLDAEGLPALLFGNLDHPRWAEVAERCLACGNCTNVCPTCFCSTTETPSDLVPAGRSSTQVAAALDADLARRPPRIGSGLSNACAANDLHADHPPQPGSNFGLRVLDGHDATQVRLWDSCFTEEHGAMHGASVRPTTRDRYRQWLTHKLGGWVPQFGVSGCVGCGRCVVWCPVGIDLTEEVAAIRESAAPPVALPAHTPRQAPGVDDLSPRTVEVVEVVRETSDVVTLRLRLEGSVAHRPGQFHQLGLPAIGEAPISISGRVAADGSGHHPVAQPVDHVADNVAEYVAAPVGEYVAEYVADPVADLADLAAPVADPAAERCVHHFVDHTIRAVGAVTRALCALSPGDQLGLRGPYGRAWPLDALRGHPVVIVAGGIGLAPLREVLREMLARPADYPDVRLFYGARSPDDALYLDELRALARPGFTLRVSVDHATTAWRGEIGVVTRLLRGDAVPEGAACLMCGPEVMMRFSIEALRAAGLPDDRIWVTMERHMKCAAGFCGRCQYGPYFVCKDGPVFRLDEVELLFGRDGF